LDFFYLTFVECPAKVKNAGLMADVIFMAIELI